ncbi:putative oxidoreductase CatD [Waddlia chondrophila 2032/99]|uniref:Putative membrane protein n=2 Tax=Waddlia chondrophila TaxID=71667 RepID=D6YWE8_WADCW|nr:DoxX family protein [Waddlia chondrophila]ADI38459.1 putative membrane protein [Waddlia chondrophila WSU 86-1044]CCB91541.1 putative oxidoreductase CatD [Waddlia chondrophila 2032/99]
MRFFYDKIVCLGEFLQSYFLLALRLYWGYSFFQAGFEKIKNTAPVVDFFTSLGIPFSEYMALIVGWIEVVGGICLLVGFASRLVAIPLALTMIGALLTAHGDATFAVLENSQRFINQTPFTYLLTSLIVLCFGPGKFSVDYVLERAFSKK